MPDQLRPIPVANNDVVVIVQVLQPGTDGAANNPTPEAVRLRGAPRALYKTQPLRNKTPLIHRPR